MGVRTIDRHHKCQQCGSIYYCPECQAVIERHSSGAERANLYAKRNHPSPNGGHRGYNTDAEACDFTCPTCKGKS